MLPPKSAFITVNGIRLHSLDWGGSGPTCLLLHGTGMCAGSWEPIVTRIGNRLRCIAVDLRSHGNSGQSPTPVTWEMLGDDLAAFYKAIDIRAALVVAHSRGGGTTILSTSQCPERFAGAYLIEPTLIGRPRMGGGREVKPRRTLFSSRQAFFDSIKGRGGFKHVTDESLWAYVNHGTKVLPDGQVELKCPPEVETQFHAARMDTDRVWNAVSRMTFPIVLVYAKNGFREPEGAETKQFLAMTKATFETFPGTHNTSMEYPDLHATRILAFADQLQSEGRFSKQSVQ